MCDTLKESVDRIKSIFHRISTSDSVITRKEKIDWNYLSYIEDEKSGFSASYYVMKIGVALLDEGYISYDKWKNKMFSELYFLNNYPHSYCTEIELQNIVDGAWNSYYYGETIWYKAWKRMPFSKRMLINFNVTKIAGWGCLISQLLLSISCEFVYFFYLSVLLLIATIFQHKKVEIYYLYPLSQLIFNIVVNLNDYSIGGPSLFIDSSIKTTVFLSANLIIAISFFVFYINRHNLASFYSARQNELIRDFREW